MMCYHARQFQDPQTQVQQARALLDFLIDAGPVGDDQYHALLRRELEIVRGRQDSYLFHEHLEEDNDPLFFQEFIERAAGNPELKSDLASTYFQSGSIAGQLGDQSKAHARLRKEDAGLRRRPRHLRLRAMPRRPATVEGWRSPRCRAPAYALPG